MAKSRPYLVLACRPDADALWLEWPDAFGARWSSLALRASGWAVTVLRGEPAQATYSMRRTAGRPIALPLTPVYS